MIKTNFWTAIALGIVALLGIVIAVVAVFYGTAVGDWIDAHSAVTFPSSIPLLALAGLGVIVAVLALIASILVLRNNPAANKIPS